MSLRPEQIQALDYARRQGTEASLDSIRARVERTFGEIEALLDAVPAETAALRPTPAKWSVHQIVDHLIESHRPAVGEMTLLLAGTSPTTGPVPASLVSADPFARPWPALLGDLRAVHRDLLALLTAADDDASQAARAPVVMVVKCATADGGVEPVAWVESFDWKAYIVLIRAHTLEHLFQIQRTLAVVGRQGTPTGTGAGGAAGSAA